MPEAVSLEFELTPEEWVTAQTAHYEAVHARRGDVKELQNTTAALFAALGVVGLVLGLWFTTAIWAALGVATTRMLPGRVRKGTRAQLEKAAAEGIIPGLFGKHRLELREEGLLNITEGYEYLTRWGAVEGVETADGLFVIYTGAHSFLPIPESAFGGAEELRAFSDAFHTLRGLAAEAPDESPRLAARQETHPEPGKPSGSAAGDARPQPPEARPDAGAPGADR